VVVIRGDTQCAILPPSDAHSYLVTGGQETDREPVIAAQNGVGVQPAGGQDLQRAVAPDLLERPALTLDLTTFGSKPSRSIISI
jgi:hypothetical protein